MFNKRYNNALYIFHRDLRLEDNTGLINASKSSRNVIPCFIFNPEQIKDNPYRNDNSIQFMLECLRELDKQLRKYQSMLHLFYGKPEEILYKLSQNKYFDAVYSNLDYTPYSIARDKRLSDVCKEFGIPFVQCSAALLIDPNNLKT